MIWYLNAIRFLICKPFKITKPSGKQACRSLFINTGKSVFPNHIFMQMKSHWKEYQGLLWSRKPDRALPPFPLPGREKFMNWEYRNGAPANVKDRRGDTTDWVSEALLPTHPPTYPSGQMLGSFLSKSLVTFTNPTHLKNRRQTFTPASQRAALLRIQIIRALFLLTPMK